MRPDLLLHRWSSSSVVILLGFAELNFPFIYSLRIHVELPSRFLSRQPKKSTVSPCTVRYFVMFLQVISRKLFNLRRSLISVYSIEALERCRNWESSNCHISSITHHTSRKLPFYHRLLHFMLCIFFLIIWRKLNCFLVAVSCLLLVMDMLSVCLWYYIIVV